MFNTSRMMFQTSAPLHLESACFDPHCQGPTIDRSACDRQHTSGSERSGSVGVAGGVGWHVAGDHRGVCGCSCLRSLQVHRSGRCQVWIAEPHTLGFLRGQCRFGSLAGRAPFLLCDRSVYVQEERVGVRDVAAQEGDMGRHKPGDEGNIPR